MKYLFIALLSICGSNSLNHNHTTSYYKVNREASHIFWNGSAKDRTHTGSFDVNGNLRLAKNGTITGGDFIIPIASIKDFDLPDNVKSALLNDLKSRNFFNILLHPVARFHLTRVRPVNNNNADTSAIRDANVELRGDFTMVGQTHAVSFPAKVTVNGNQLHTEARFKINRTQWGMNIYIDPQAALYIYPDVAIKLDIQAFRPNL